MDDPRVWVCSKDKSIGKEQEKRDLSSDTQIYQPKIDAFKSRQSWGEWQGVLSKWKTFHMKNMKKEGIVFSGFSILKPL